MRRGQDQQHVVQLALFVHLEQHSTQGVIYGDDGDFDTAVFALNDASIVFKRDSKAL